MTMNRSGVPAPSAPDRPTRVSGGNRNDVRVCGTDRPPPSAWVDADTQPIEVTADHPWSPVTITTGVRGSRRAPAAARPRRLTGRSSPQLAAAQGRLVRTPGSRPPPPRAAVDRTRAWLAVALVAAAVVLVAVASDASTVPPLGMAQRPVITTVITVSAVPDPRATEGPSSQNRQRVLSW
jgi:hypothetical protein